MNDTTNTGTPQDEDFDFGVILSQIPEPHEDIIQDGGWLQSAAYFVNNTPDVKWIVKKLVAYDTLNMFYGPSNHGKSFYVLDVGLSVASGIDWHGNKVKQGPVIYVCGEGGSGVRKRIKAWCKHHGIDVGSLQFYISKTSGDLSNPARLNDSFAHFEEKLTVHGSIAMLIIDTLARNIGSFDENSNHEVGKAITNLDIMRDRLGGPAVVIVHHTGKYGEAERGASCLRGAMDFCYRVSKDKGLYTMECDKVKDGEPIDTISLSLHNVALGYCDEDGEPVSSAVLVSPLSSHQARYNNECDDPTTMLTDSQEFVMTKLQKKIHEAEKMMSDSGLDTRGVSLSFSDFKKYMEGVSWGKRNKPTSRNTLRGWLSKKILPRLSMQFCKNDPDQIIKNPS